MVVVHICNPSNRKAEVGGPRIGGQSELQSKFQASLGYTARPCFRKRKGRKEGRKGEREGGRKEERKIGDRDTENISF
jgi:hypothetical protein